VMRAVVADNVAELSEARWVLGDGPTLAMRVLSRDGRGPSPAIFLSGAHPRPWATGNKLQNLTSLLN
jgi:hypothetical protein